jgi:hypothetical protein
MLRKKSAFIWLAASCPRDGNCCFASIATKLNKLIVSLEGNYDVTIIKLVDHLFSIGGHRERYKLITPTTNRYQPTELPSVGGFRYQRRNLKIRSQDGLIAPLEIFVYWLVATFLKQRL